MADHVAPTNQSSSRWTDLLTARNLIGTVIVVVALLFVFQNTQTGHFHFLFFNISAPRWLWLLGVFAGGFVSGRLFTRHRAAKAAAS
jgi:uncharacterized integral membrane protein